MDESSIIEGLKPVCRCMGIPKKVFLRHIASGIDTVEALQRLTGAGTGSCKGRQCTSRLSALVQSVHLKSR
jgi:NAD(P)H-nitrite reductase large subunit